MANLSPSEPRILYIISQLGRGGAEQQFYYLLKYLRPNARVISLTSGGYWAGPLRDMGYEVIEPERRGRADLRRFLRIIQETRNYKPHVIHIYIDGVYGLYGRLIAILLRHPRVIVGERSNPAFDPIWYIQARALLLNRFVRFVVANSQAAYCFLTHEMKLPTHKGKFIPNGLEIERIVKESTDGPNPLSVDWQNRVVVIFMGGLSSPKVPELFVRVAKRVVDQYPDVRFVMVGDGELHGSVESIRHQLGLDDMVLLAGHQFNVPRWLSASSIFLMTSSFEGMPNALMEAMAVGLPSVVTKVGGCAELVSEGETGYIVPVGDELALADRVIRLVSDANLRQSMGSKAQLRILQFDVQSMVEQYKAIYDSILQS
jgi:glycosyltransferase involved in cell wall biosynthesis